MHVDLGLGKIIETQKLRDAIHVAVAPVICGDEELKPGAHVGFTVPFDSQQVVSAASTKLIGIVDPFLKAPVTQYQRFWMFLYPETVTGMRHEWQHPDFLDDDDDDSPLRCPC